MSRFKSMPLALAAAILAVAFAAPATASAAEWRYAETGEGIKSPVSLEIADGVLGTETFGSGASCAVQGEAVLSPGDKGEISEFDLNAETCDTWGAYDGCSVESVETGGIPWAFKITDGELAIGGVSYAIHFTGPWGVCDNTLEVNGGQVSAYVGTGVLSTAWLLEGQGVKMTVGGNPTFTGRIDGELIVPYANYYEYR